MDGQQRDLDLFATIESELYTAVIGDILDRLGHAHQFLPPSIRPLRPDAFLVGRAMPVLEADVFDNSQPFGKMFEALDSLRPGEVYLVTGGTARYAVYGELMATAATARGARGAVLCGYHRDTRQLQEMDHPVFSYGAFAQDQGIRGRVIDYRVPVEVAGVRIEPGDLVVGDIDGVVVVPHEIEGLVVEEAREKARIETDVKRSIKQGMATVEAFKKYGVM